MRKLLGYLLPLAIFGGAAYALTNPASFAPRSFPTQQTHYERHIINITTSGCSADAGQGQTNVFAAGSCSVKVGALPYNAFLVRAYQQVITACNAGTTCTLGIGGASGNTAWVAPQAITAAGNATSLTLALAGLLPAVPGNPATGANGGFDAWITIAQTGTVASAGTAIIVLEFISSNDGGCVYVPLGGTAPAC